MNNYEKHFDEELRIMKEHMTDDDGELLIEDFIENVKEITKVFSKQGHSGGSAPYYASTIANTIKKVLMFEPLSPIYGTDEEWGNEIDPNMYQNKRFSALFKNNKTNNGKINNKPYTVDAIIWQGVEEWDTFTGQVEDVASWQYIKGFPFTPKKFYIDVIYEDYDETKHGENAITSSGDNGNYVTFIKDRNQLKEVEEYYDVLEQLKELNPKKYYKITRKQKLKKLENVDKNSK